MTKTDSFEIGKLPENGEGLKPGEVQPRKSESIIVAWLFIAVLAIATLIAGYELWEKVALPSP